MLKRTMLSKSVLIAFGGTALSAVTAFGQSNPPAPTELQRVEITGSAIKRIDAETALPVMVLKREGRIPAW